MQLTRLRVVEAPQSVEPPQQILWFGPGRDHVGVVAPAEDARDVGRERGLAGARRAEQQERTPRLEGDVDGEDDLLVVKDVHLVVRRVPRATAVFRTVLMTCPGRVGRGVELLVVLQHTPLLQRHGQALILPCGTARQWRNPAPARIRTPGR